jgi:hypothetical protein
VSNNEKKGDDVMKTGKTNPRGQCSKDKQHKAPSGNPFQSSSLKNNEGLGERVFSVIYYDQRLGNSD